MAAAVGAGTAKVLCAGVAAKKPMARQLGNTFDTRVPEVEGKRQAVEAYRSTIDMLPEIPTPC